MGRQIKIRAIRKEGPDIGLYVLALIALARQLQEEDARPDDEASASAPQPGKEDEG